MSDQKDKELLSSLHALREALSAHADQVLDASEYVSLSQSFDRLYLGYQSGAYTPEQTRGDVRDTGASFRRCDLIPSACAFDVDAS